MYAGKVIAIDGPAGSGKSTIARMVARRLGFEYLDTGAMYRAAAWVVREEKLNLADPQNLQRLVTGWKVSFIHDGELTRVYHRDREITEAIRDEEITASASDVARLPKIREFLVVLQKKRIATGSVVAEGRDIGTVVAPRADVKIYLDATPRTRAERRLLEYAQRGIPSTLKEQIEKLADRDKQDSERQASPLRKAADAILVDATKMNIEEAAEAVLLICKTRMVSAASSGGRR